MKFGQALDHITTTPGTAQVARANWNGKGMYIYIKPGINVEPEVEREHISGVPVHLFEPLPPEHTNLGIPTFMPCLVMKTADNTHVPGWLASQTDMLAVDWVIVA